MKLAPPQSAWLLLAVLATGGCALNGLPRIDPSGERFLIWPSSQAVVGPPVAPGTVIAPPGGNVTLPPVGPAGSTAAASPACPVCPLCPLCPLGGLLEGPKVIGPLAGAPPADPTNRVTLSPGRVLAPVGSEVVLRAGVCGAEGYLLTNRKIEWMIDQEGVGQFAEVGDAGERDFLRYPWSTPHKINNTYAVGYTSPVHTCLRRGTADPSDDLQIEDGEAWISVTSPAEGTSYITAYAPDEENWNARRAQAVIYWVDAKWQLPPSAMVATGQPHVLETLVTRQTDGAPLAGWIVRYEVADSSAARLGYEAGQVAEVTTDGRGVARVEVSPNDAQPQTSRIRITVVRPEQAGIASSPRLDVGSGEASVTWSDTAPGTQPLFPPVNPQPTDPGLPQPSLPPAANPLPTTPPATPGPTEPPIGIEPAGQPDLQVTIRKNTPDPIKAGGEVSFTIVVRNMGDGVARNVRVLDRFDEGLTTSIDTTGAGEITYNDAGELRPGGGMFELPVTFDVLSAGEHWHNVTVTADGGVEVFQRSTFTAVEDRPTTATLNVRTAIAPAQPTVGDEVRFSIEIENASDSPATNLRIEVAPDPALTVNGILPRPLAEATTPQVNGGAVTLLEDLPPRQKRTVHYGFRCNLATEIGAPAEIRAFITGAGINEVGSERIEILPPVTPGPAAQPLSVSVSSRANPVRLRSSSDLVVTLKNNTAQPLAGVSAQIAIPQQLSFRTRVATVPAGTSLIEQGGFLQLSPAMIQLAPGATQQIVVPYDAIGAGQAVIDVRAGYQGVTQPATARDIITVQP